MIDNEQITDIWQKYQNGKEYLNKLGVYTNAEKCHKFYIGDQWDGLQADGEDLPIFNFIKPIVRYKVGTVSQNTMVANYTPFDKTPGTQRACELLNVHFAKAWERAKMDSLSWKIIKDAAITGDGYIYFGSRDDLSSGQIIDNVNIFLSDEQTSDIQAQKYIIIRERLFVSDVKQKAKENKISEEDIESILPDSDTEEQLGNKEEVETAKSDNGKCTCLLYMAKDDEGYVHITRSTRTVIYQKDTILQAEPSEMDIAEGITDIPGVKSYPVINFIWEDRKNSARGVGEVEFLIPNQLEVNKTLARRSICIKQVAFPKLAYAAGAVRNPDDLNNVGALIAVENATAQNINNMLAYLNPTIVSPDAKNLSDELISMSRELAGAGDAAMGSIDPTKASGTAIIAVRDQTALPLNEQITRYQQMAEDLAYLWFDLWVAYNPNGITVDSEDENGNEIQEVIPREVLDSLKVNVRVDISRANPYSKFAQEQGLQNLLAGQYITFDEYVKALDSDSAIPKGKLQDILDDRAIEQQKQAMLEQLQAQNQQLGGMLEQATGALNSLMGQEQGQPQQQIQQFI